MGFIYFQMQSSSYRTIYGALAAVPIVLTWIYLNWVIILYGAELTATIEGIVPSDDIDEQSPEFTRLLAASVICRTG